MLTKFAANQTGVRRSNSNYAATHGGMALTGTSLEALTGRLGVGAIAFLGLFLTVDGLKAGAFEMIELYGKSTTWGIVGVIPTAVVIYIVGVFCVGVAELLLARFPALRGPEPSDVLAVSLSGGPVLQQWYGDYIRNHELLKGAAVSFVILGFGSLAEFRNLPGPGYASLVWICAAGALALCVLSLVFSRRSAAQAGLLARVVKGASAA